MKISLKHYTYGEEDEGISRRAFGLLTNKIAE